MSVTHFKTLLLMPQLSPISCLLSHIAPLGPGPSMVCDTDSEPEASLQQKNHYATGHRFCVKQCWKLPGIMPQGPRATASQLSHMVIGSIRLPVVLKHCSSRDSQAFTGCHARSTSAWSRTHRNSIIQKFTSNSQPALPSNQPDRQT